jgi:hypothetical protein
MLYLRNMHNIKYSKNVHSYVQTRGNKTNSQDVAFKKNILKYSVPEKTIVSTNHTSGKVGRSTEIIKPRLP